MEQALFGAIAGLFATLMTVIYKYIAYLQDENKHNREKVVPLLERQQNLLERIIEDRRGGP